MLILLLGSWRLLRLVGEKVLLDVKLETEERLTFAVFENVQTLYHDLLVLVVKRQLQRQKLSFVDEAIELLQMHLVLEVVRVLRQLREGVEVLLLYQ